MTKVLYARYECDFCEATVMVEMQADARTKDEIPPGWGVVLFTVRPSNPDVADWSKHKYHACSFDCANELVDKYYPRNPDFAAKPQKEKEESSA